MPIYYSAAHRGFFDPQLHAQLPADAVAISDILYQQMLTGQAAGNAIVPAPNGQPMLTAQEPPAPSVPAVVSRFQAREALIEAGLMEQVEAAVSAAAIANPRIARAWHDSVEFIRASPTITALADAVGLTDEQVDQLFIAAAQISA